MSVPWELIASFGVGLALICLTGYLLLAPMKLMWRLAASAVAGALTLGLVNLIGGIFGFTVAVNPFTAISVGFLGLPGAILVIVLSLLL